MRAIVLEQKDGRGHLTYTENRRIPEPKDDEIRVKVKSAGLNPVDYKLADGWGDVPWPEQPVLGLDVAGVVESTGKNAGHYFKEGDRVFYHGSLAKVNGGFAEYACTSAHTVSRLPAHIDFVTAAALPCAGFTAYQATVDKLKIDETKSILIHAGAGGVGGYAIQLARYLGAGRILTTCSSENSDYVRSLGADTALDYHVEDLYECVMEETDGRGLDYVINTIDRETATKDIDLLAFSGQLVAVVELPDFSRLRFYEKGMSIHEVALGGAHMNGDFRAQLRLAEIGDCYVKLLEEGKIQPPYITEITLDEIPRAFELLRERHVRGKIVASVK